MKKNIVKQKTKKGVAKRFTVRPSGKIKYSSKGLRHGLSNKSRKRKRHLVKSRTVKLCNKSAIKKLIPYI